MNIAQLKAFLAVVDEGSFSAAARVLGISQPAVTMQIRALEEDLNAVLLDRRYRKIDLTEAGKELLVRARRIFVELEGVRTSISALSGTVSGHLSIAASTTPGDYVLPALLGAFLAKYPDVEVALEVGDSAGVATSVENGEADFAMTGAKSDARVEFKQIGEDELIVIAYPGNPLSGSGPVDIGSLLDKPWIMREQGSGTRSVTEHVFRERGLNPDSLPVVVELGSGEAVIGAVEGGLGIAMLSRYVAEKSLKLGTVVKVELTEKINRPFYAVLPKGTPTRAALAFNDHLHEALGS